MPKKVFLPATLVIMGFILLASNMGMLPYAFWNLWPLILIIVGLGGLLISDRDDWNSKSFSSSVPKKRTVKTKKSAKAKRK